MRLCCVRDELIEERTRARFFRSPSATLLIYAAAVRERRFELYFWIFAFFDYPYFGLMNITEGEKNPRTYYVYGVREVVAR